MYHQMYNSKEWILKEEGKAAHSILACLTDVHEPLLTQMLATQYPTLVPRVLATHNEKRWS
jgi:hypothetical protein